ncbi:MAG: type II/IV secretion system protein [Candidatus Eremiobacteraeota bacterium]|nr:type II/IV secretion system protein [Candidatus Eremiobacteraeota bacterium]
MTLSYAVDGFVDDSPAVRAADEIFEAAIKNRASDVHLEPWCGAGRVRERVDGMLRESRRISEPLFAQILSRIKLLAGMDITDRRLPQDGRYTIERGGRTFDVRVSSIPTIEGERLAMRLLEARAQIPTLEALGMPPGIVARFRRMCAAPAGFVIVCGPTGSGKTTTLYAALAQRNERAQHLCSVEDPVEACIPGLAQVQVNVRAGLDFPSVLRAFLRQDPNAIMIGEMRDAETASVGVGAALSGQAVFTTLHSNDALGAVERLLELGISARSVANAVTGIVAQRLVRQLCPDCKEATAAGPDAGWIGIDAAAIVANARGCERCLGTGYWGRSGVFELVEFGAQMRVAVDARALPAARRKIALAAGYEPMLANARQLVLRGETSIEEVVRVLDGVHGP